MHCVHAKKKLQLYIDNRLSLHELRALENHLASCTSCYQDLTLLETVSDTLASFPPVIEPADLTANIMRRVAQDVEARERRARDEQIQRQQMKRHELLRLINQSYALFKLSLQELLAVLLLASVTMLGIILTLPSLRSVLPFMNRQGPISHAIFSLLHALSVVDSDTLTWAFWILGTLLGISITLALAGNEVRRSWFKAMTDRLPVW